MMGVGRLSRMTAAAAAATTTPPALSPQRKAPLSSRSQASQLSAAAQTPLADRSAASLVTSSPMDVGIDDDLRDIGEDDLFLDSVRRLDDMRMRFVKSLAHRTLLLP